MAAGPVVPDMSLDLVRSYFKDPGGIMRAPAAVARRLAALREGVG